MSGTSGIGALLRDLRRARELTLAAAAHHVGCAESQLSCVESGRRTLHPWLATELDRLYETNGMIVDMVHARDRASHHQSDTATLDSNMLLAPTPDGETPMPIDRRDLLAYLGTGMVTNPVAMWLGSVHTLLEPDQTTLSRADNALANYQAAGRRLPAQMVLDGMTGQLALLDHTRRRANATLRPQFLALQARYAEALSWFSEEVGDATGALFWIDRAAQWAQSCDWAAMSGYTFVRRSMAALSLRNDSHRAIDEARLAFDHPRVPPRIRGLAAKQLAFSYALRWEHTASHRAVDDAVRLLIDSARNGDEPGQGSLDDEDLYAIFRTTCEIHLGHGTHAIELLQPKLTNMSHGSVRTMTITQAKLARAYANIGQPHEAVGCLTRTLDTHAEIQSQSSYRELLRAAPVLAQWRQRSDIHSALQRLRAGDVTNV